LIDWLERSVYEIDTTFQLFHNKTTVEQSHPALQLPIFQEWAATYPESLPLRSDQIVGYRIPLSLGGKHELSNLVLVDSEVELELNRQIDEQIRDLPEGTPINTVGSDQ
jgi:hypothetical protein